MKRFALLCLFIFSFSGHFLCAGPVDSSVVLIHCTSQSWSFNEPWKMGSPSKGSGTGFVVQGNQIITNAHVVSNAIYIEIQRIGDDKKYMGQVEYIAHDCDLAILSIQETPDFFESMTPLELGGLPEIDSMVTTYGFPLGGSHLSVTRGVVSRIQMWNYVHSGSDSHLVIQTDAAINPGNSGGPVLQDGKVVGVAFQGLTQADNIGYLIPCSVVEHVLKDIEDGKLHGFGELGFSYRHDLQNPITRRLLKFPEDESGVLVTKVYPRMPAFGNIKPLDILSEVGDYRIRNDGIVIMDGREIDFAEVMERAQVGDQLPIVIWRNGERIELTLTLEAWDTIISHRRPYGEKPKYLVRGGLCFTPLSMGFIATFGGLKKMSPPVRHLFRHALSDESLTIGQEFPVLSMVLPDEINQEAKGFLGCVLVSLNGIEIKNMMALKTEIENSTADFLELKFLGVDLPLVLDRLEVLNRGPALLDRYHVAQGENL
jgi:S1-C subfamily serine protease